MQLGDPAIITVEERHKVAREVFQITRLEAANDAEVDRGVARIGRIFRQDEDIARVHVGVKEIVMEHLREKDLHAMFC